MTEKIRVLIVEDSSLKSLALKSILNSDPGIEVIAVAKNGKEGVAKARELQPDVITMDLHMPVMNGQVATEKIMQDNPTPIIIVSTLDKTSIIKTMSFGAMDYVSILQGIDEIAFALVKKVKTASKVKPIRHMKLRSPVTKGPIEKTPVFKIVTIGISTGGPQALNKIFPHFPEHFPAGILIVQHMSKGFIANLAEWLGKTSFLDVRVARAGEFLKEGQALLAPDDLHLQIAKSGRIELVADTDGSLHVPSIDNMMISASASFKNKTIGVIMTGMGKDGVKGMRAIKKGGGTTIAQDKESSVVYGMNQAAINEGLIEKIVPLESIAGEIIRRVI